MSHIQIRISEEEKREAQEVFSAMGLTMSGAIKIFIRRTVQLGKLPFDLRANTDFKIPRKLIKKQIPPLKKEIFEEKLIAKESNSSKKGGKGFMNFINRDI